MFKRKKYLDLHEVELKAWEHEKSALLVAAMAEGIKLGHKFPAVEVVKRDDYYELVLDRFADGGHHRALAHYIEGVPLECRIIRKHRTGGFEGTFISLGDVVLSRGESVSQLTKSLSYLPRDVSEKFCRENDLDVNRYLSQ